MGFSALFQDLIFRIISGIWYRININGFMSSPFQSSRGVRQGDPLSPMLFILAQQVLSFNLNQQLAMGRLLPFRMGRSISPISHLFFADDMLIFTNGRLRSLRRLKLLLQH